MRCIKPFTINAGLWQAMEKSKEGTIHSVWQEMWKADYNTYKQSLYDLVSCTNEKRMTARRVAEAYGIPIEEFGKLVTVKQVVEPYFTEK